jgi:hypothetical protein
MHNYFVILIIDFFFFFLQNVFPGLWLGSITVEAYKVTDAPGQV